MTQPPRRSADKPLIAQVAVGRTSGDRLAQGRGHSDSRCSPRFGRAPGGRFLAAAVLRHEFQRSRSGRRAGHVGVRVDLEAATGRIWSGVRTMTGACDPGLEWYACERRRVQPRHLRLSRPGASAICVVTRPITMHTVPKRSVPVSGSPRKIAARTTPRGAIRYWNADAAAAGRYLRP